MFGIFRKKKQPEAASDVGSTESLDDIRTRIVPVIKLMEYDDPGAVSLQLSKEDSPVSRPLAADLIIFYAEDLPDSFVFVSQKRMEELGLTPESLHSLSVSNLPDRIPPLEVHGDAPRRMATCGGNFEATLLLHDGLWDHVAADTTGEIMAVVPARDLLFFSDSAWDGAVAFLSELANQEQEDQNHLLSRCLLVRRNGTWIAAAMQS